MLRCCVFILSLFTLIACERSTSERPSELISVAAVIPPTPEEILAQSTAAHDRRAREEGYVTTSLLAQSPDAAEGFERLAPPDDAFAKAIRDIGSMPEALALETDPSLTDYPHSTRPETYSQYVAGYHIDDGPDFSRLVPHNYVHSPGGYNASRYFPPDYKHADEDGVAKTSLVPPNYKHVAEQGPVKSAYYPPNWKHAEQDGPEKSRYVPNWHDHVPQGPGASSYEDRNHEHWNRPGPDNSQFVPRGSRHFGGNFPERTAHIPPGWRHIHEDLPDRSGMLPREYRHVPQDGPHKTEFFPPEFKHADQDGPDKSDMFKEHKHAKKGRAKSFYLPEDLRHIERDGPDKTRYVPPDWQHIPEDGPSKSAYRPPEYEHNNIPGPWQSAYHKPGWKHVEEDGPEKSRFVPPSWKHADEDGPDKSRYFPPGWKHVKEEGPFKSKYVPGHWKHVREDGPDKTKYVPPDWKHAREERVRSQYFPPNFKHADKEGPVKSTYVPGNYKHADQPGPDLSLYFPPDYKHIDREDSPDKSFYRPDSWKHADKQGPDFSRFLPPDWKHIDEGQFASYYDGPRQPGPGGVSSLPRRDTRRMVAGMSSAPADGFLTNDDYIDSLVETLDIQNADAVFAYVFGQLKEQVTVYPSENYYYFQFSVGGRKYMGSFSLFAENRDDGIFGFGYSQKVDKYAQPTFPVIGGGNTYSREEGVDVKKISDFEYDVTYANKTVRFNLHDPGLSKPESLKLADGEVFVAPTQDESGLRFSLIFNTTIDRLYWILDEDGDVTETFTPISPHVVIGARTQFAFYVAEAGARKLLIGVDGYNVLQNNWYDGPFDQLPDNQVYSGRIEVQSYIERSYPGVKGRIDKYGNYLDEDGARVAVAPYTVYFDQRSFLSIEAWLAQGLSQTALLERLTQQHFDVPEEVMATKFTPHSYNIQPNPVIFSPQ